VLRATTEKASSDDVEKNIVCLLERCIGLVRLMWSVAMIISGDFL